MTKSEDDLKQEREQAAEQLAAILQARRPKGLKEGVLSGASNIVTGAVGAAGIAVLAPTVGLSAGMSQGGLLGGILGLTGGVVIGAVGAAAMALGGAISGISQVARGIIATPESIVAPRQGKCWNEYEGKWVLTDLPAEAKSTLKDIPDDDSDILGMFQKELDESIREGKHDDQVKDMSYYDALEVPADATSSAIKRQYYLLARKYHPDKVGTDDKEAADKFKDVAEAYQVLSDEELRTQYNKVGKEGLSADKTELVGPNASNLDPSLLFAFLFGSDKFQDFTGRFATATSASVGDTQKISISTARKLQKRRVVRLAVKLVDRIEAWIETTKVGGSTEVIEDAWKNEAVDLSKTSYGYHLVTTIGKIYNLAGTMNEGSLDSGHGLPKLSEWAARQNAVLEKRKASQGNDMDKLRAGFDMMHLKMESDKRMQLAKTDEEREAITRDLVEQAQAVMLRILWTTTVVDITATLHETCKMVFFDQSVDAETRKLRASAVKQLGQVWMDIPEPEGQESDAAKLYEDAAFAAMLETMSRKDEATK